ncbi:DAK2 domain-containing protein [Paraburkholderia caballeronis]|uniref:Dihydroxyacetone kinase/dihydroxyacetone kinase, C-terminal domain n=1 Tax=Paraburkholderia caballeronis TaxID=416943 RepID=A0A1H7V7W1_9BURK|nr:DAK2 domain-containing protein [Paraburkholderia caballeronis]PXW16463.1 dihydroxyacetone kinase-like protein [Paraburkholderia caballeronis]PXW94260.1 dihydroxyacetone kinase-like protein [Paraburkholderia caballeronis]RAJ89713.1 dihydroxyacetone kinase-like protein [Paraburkholderia caballeronis]SED92902.1 dihydroxyacetone kinase/dihydroxyacetone kinase, C-terminal domain [Paraburkholderia caballeronis]SEM05323.1 dihydroxyacetone kinase/dihydroxyacetone kinase, C-terminal domain [Paraburk
MSVSADQLRAWLIHALEAMPAHEDALRDLDAALGDGDLGITVRKGSAAVVDAFAALPPGATITEMLLAAGKAFSTANPSTFAALVGGGLIAGAKAAAGKDALGKADALAIGRAIAARIADRGKAVPGDKTVLDALGPSLDALEASDGDTATLLAAMIETASRQVSETAALQSRRGRAAWVQERSIGHADPGATAYLLFLQALRGTMGAV